MPKLHYILAVICYLSIPVVVVCGVALFVLIDPEMARGHINYTRDYQWLDRARGAVLGAAASLACLLWIGCCYLVLKARQRSLRWLPLAAAGPFGFSVIAALEDRLPASSDRYQHVIRRLKTYRRALLEIAVFVGVWFVAYESVVLKRELMTALESLTSGTPIAAILAQQTASSGMWAAGEGLEQLYLVPLLYLLWPIVFNIAGWVFRHQPPQASSASIRLNSKS
jgi:hypothetical protein